LNYFKLLVMVTKNRYICRQIQLGQVTGLDSSRLCCNPFIIKFLSSHDTEYENVYSYSSVWCKNVVYVTSH